MVTSPNSEVNTDVGATAPGSVNDSTVGSADDQRDGARFSLIWGNADDLGGWELGYAIQRAQRDAVLAAFAEDDWWFHTFARGYMPWVAYGINANWAVQATAFIERRDAIDQTTNRYLLDLRSRW